MNSGPQGQGPDPGGAPASPAPPAPASDVVQSLARIEGELRALGPKVDAIGSQGSRVPIVAACIAGLGGFVAAILGVVSYWSGSAIERDLKRATTALASTQGRLAEIELNQVEADAQSVELRCELYLRDRWRDAQDGLSGWRRGAPPWHAAYSSMLERLRDRLVSIADVASFCLEALEPLDAMQFSVRDGSERVRTYSASFRAPYVYVRVELRDEDQPEPTLQIWFEEVVADETRGAWHTALTIAFGFEGGGGPEFGLAKFRDPQIAEWARSSQEPVLLCGRRIRATPTETRWGITTVEASADGTLANTWRSQDYDPEVYPTTLNKPPVRELRRRVAELRGR